MPSDGMMNAAVHTDAFRLTVMRKPLPRVAEFDDVLVKVGAVGFCGSDKHDLDHAPGVQQIPGHEFAGVIEELGREPGDFRVGDRVVVKPQARCGVCEACMQRPRGECTKGGVYGCSGNQPPGGMAEFVLVRTENLTRVPDDVSLEEAAMADPLAVALYAVEVSPDVAGRNCVIMGAGVIGLLLAQVLRMKGAGRIALVDVIPSHLEAAKQFGDFECYLADDREALTASLRDVHSGIFYELAGGESPTLNIAVHSIDNGGHIMLVSQRPKGTWLDYQFVLFKGLHLDAVSGTSQSSWNEALDLIFARRIQVLPLITHRYPLDQATEALLTAVHGDSLKVMLKPNGDIW